MADRHVAARRNQAAVHRRHHVAVDVDGVVAHRAVVVSGEVEIGVIRHVDDGRLVGRRLIVERQVAVVVPRDGHVRRQIAGEVLLHIGGNVVELDGIHRIPRDGRRLPDLLLEAGFAAMQGIFAVVLVEVIFRAVEGEAAAADAVREAPDGIAHRAVAALIMRQRIEAEGNVRQLAVLVRHENIGYNRAEVKHGHGRAGMVRQGIHRHVLTVLGRAERAGGNRHSVSSSYSCVNHASALLYITRGICARASGEKKRGRSAQKV